MANDKTKQILSDVGHKLKSLFVSDTPGVEPGFKKLWEKDGTKNLASTFLAIVFGLIISFFVILFTAIGSDTMPVSDAGGAIRILLGSVFYEGKNASGELTFGFNKILFGNMLFRATPLIMTGLSVAFAYKTGLFNIGASGQFLMGAMVSLLIGLSIPTSSIPGWLVWLIALICGMAAGFVWGCVPGLFKAFFNVNEVITCIMCNWIGLYIVSWIFGIDKAKGVEGAQFVNFTEGTKSNFLYKTASRGVTNPSFGLDKLFEGSQVDGGIIIAILIAIIVMIIMSKTVFGYELKATGNNRYAAKYAGIKDKRNIVLAMGISGALAAAGAVLLYFNRTQEFNYSNDTSLPAEGFNGIPVALLAYSNPIGAIFSAIFMAYVNIGGEQIKGAFAINSHISDLIVAIIVYLSAFSLMFKDILAGRGLIAKMVRGVIAKKKNAISESESIAQEDIPILDENQDENLILSNVDLDETEESVIETESENEKGKVNEEEE